MPRWGMARLALQPGAATAGAAFRPQKRPPAAPAPNNPNADRRLPFGESNEDSPDIRSLHTGRTSLRPEGRAPGRWREPWAPQCVSTVSAIRRRQVASEKR